MVHRVLVLGAGYSGVLAAKRLAASLRPGQADITLVNLCDRFVERVRLHQLGAGQRLKDLPLRRMLAGCGVEPAVGRVSSLDTDRHQVEIQADDGLRHLDYDTLVYALGSLADRSTVPGVDTYASTVSGIYDARELRRRVASIPEGGRVVVVGGGLTGIEAATELAEAYPRLRVALVGRDEPGGWLSSRARRYLSRAFDRLGIEVHTGFNVTEVTAAAVYGRGGAAIDSDVTVWTTGFTVPAIARDSGLAVDDAGRILVDQTMRSFSHPEVYAIGDAAVVTGPQQIALRMACATGMPMAFQCADAIAARLSGATPHRFVFRFVHQHISLGRHDALVQFVRADDSPLGAVLTGRAAVAYKESICRLAVWMAAHPGPYLPHRRRTITHTAAGVKV